MWLTKVTNKCNTFGRFDGSSDNLKVANNIENFQKRLDMLLSLTDAGDHSGFGDKIQHVFGDCLHFALSM